MEKPKIWGKRFRKVIFELQTTKGGIRTAHSCKRQVLSEGGSNSEKGNRYRKRQYLHLVVPLYVSDPERKAVAC